MVQGAQAGQVPCGCCLHLAGRHQGAGLAGQGAAVQLAARVALLSTVEGAGGVRLGQVLVLLGVATATVATGSEGSRGAVGCCVQQGWVVLLQGSVVPIQAPAQLHVLPWAVLGVCSGGRGGGC